VIFVVPQNGGEKGAKIMKRPKARRREDSDDGWSEGPRFGLYVTINVRNSLFAQVLRDIAALCGFKDLAAEPILDYLFHANEIDARSLVLEIANEKVGLRALEHWTDNTGCWNTAHIVKNQLFRPKLNCYRRVEIICKRPPSLHELQSVKRAIDARGGLVISSCTHHNPDQIGPLPVARLLIHNGYPFIKNDKDRPNYVKIRKRLLRYGKGGKLPGWAEEIARPSRDLNPVEMMPLQGFIIEPSYVSREARALKPRRKKAPTASKRKASKKSGVSKGS